MKVIIRIITKRESTVKRGKRVQEKTKILVKTDTESIIAVTIIIIIIMIRAAKRLIPPTKPVRSRKITKRGLLIHLNLHHLLRIVLDLLLIRGRLLNHANILTIIIGTKKEIQNSLDVKIMLIGRTHRNPKEIIILLRRH